MNNRHYDRFFHSQKDEYLNVYFRYPHNILREDVKIEIDGLGVEALITVAIGQGEWQANARMPPGLRCGDHKVRVAIQAGGYGNAATIVVLPPTQPRPNSVSLIPALGHLLPPRLISVENSNDRTNVFGRFRKEQINCLFTCEANLEPDQIVLEIDEKAYPILALGWATETVRQVNASLPLHIYSGDHFVRLCVLGVNPSNALPINICAPQLFPATS